MSRFRSCWVTILSVALALTLMQLGRSQAPDSPNPSAENASSRRTTNALRSLAEQPSKPAGTHGLICTVYALSDLGDDPSLGKWIADTIPQVIQPGSWKSAEGQGTRLNHYAPAKILVVYHTA